MKRTLYAALMLLASAVFPGGAADTPARGVRVAPPLSERVATALARRMAFQEALSISVGATEADASCAALSASRRMSLAVQALATAGMGQTHVTLHRRADWARHFCAGIMMGSLSESLAEAAAEAKEYADLRPGGTGFDYNDLAMSLYGAAFRRELARQDAAQARSMLESMRAGQYDIEAVIPQPRYPHLASGSVPAEGTHRAMLAAIRREAAAIRLGTYTPVQ